MDYKRAEEILSSDGVVDVLYQGNRVWIQDIKQSNNTARVRPLEGLGSTEEVRLADLTEI